MAEPDTLIGTTDTFYDGDPARVERDADDVDYILDAANHAFPRANVTARDIISTYAGLRPLVAPEDEKHESDISRDDQIFESPPGLLSLGGGKLTTHRNVAERIVDLRRVADRPRVGATLPDRRDAAARALPGIPAGRGARRSRRRRAKSTSAPALRRAGGRSRRARPWRRAPRPPGGRRLAATCWRRSAYAVDYEMGLLARRRAVAPRAARLRSRESTSGSRAASGRRSSRPASAGTPARIDEEVRVLPREHLRRESRPQRSSRRS